MGDVLVVWLNGDASPYRFSKPGRPIHDENFRSCILNSISWVDYIFIFDEETPLLCITALLPDILLKGGDYKAEDIVGYEVVTEHWGEVVTIPTVGTYASTKSITNTLASYGLVPMNTRNVVVIGDIMLDQYHFGQVIRLNPESPNPLFNVEYIENKLWGASNVAANLAALGCQTVLIGHRWHDDHGDIISQLCHDFNIKLVALHTAQPTIVKRRYVETTYNQQLLRADIEQPIILSNSQEKEIICQVRDFNPEFVVISDYNKWVVSESLVQQLEKLAIKLLVDTKPQHLWMFKHIFLLKPNFKEFKEMIGEDITNTDDKIEKYGHVLVKKLDCHLVVSRGKEGVSLITRDWKYLHIPTDAQSVFDVSWAWDSFMAGLVTGLSQNLSLVDAVKLANKVSGIAVSRLGTAVVSQKDLVR